MPRTILHLDLDAFFCAVEERRDPSLRGLPFAVGGHPDYRGVVASCSYAARRYGVRSAMPMARARQLCPALQVVDAHYHEYGSASRQIMADLRELTPLVEPLSIDEAFLDLTRPTGSVSAADALTLARQIQAHINSAYDLPVSLGAATNKLVAKIANTQGKADAGRDSDHPPNAIKVVAPGEEAAFLAPLPVDALWGIGPKAADRLRQRGVRTVGDLARLDAATLRQLFGKIGPDLGRRAQGIDTRPVTPEHAAKSISKETTFVSDVRDYERLRRTLRGLADGVGLRLRRDGLRGRTVFIKLRWPDFTTLSRQMTLEAPVDDDEAIYQAALALFMREWHKGAAVRLLGVGVSGFDAPARQLGLWDDPVQAERSDRLSSALDDVRRRFGEDAIRRGSTVNRHPKPDKD